MKNSKQEIISELKNKLSEFKSKINNKSDNTNPENDIMNMQININTIKNYYKVPKQDNNNNIINKINPINEELQTNKKDTIINNKQDITNFQSSKTLQNNLNKDNTKTTKFNNYIKENDNKYKLRANSISTVNVDTSKNYLNFDIDEIIKNHKKPKNDKSDFNFINSPSKPENIKYKIFVNFDDLRNNLYKKKSDSIDYTKSLSNKNFIKLNLSSKKSFPSNMSNTDRNYRLKNYNLDSYYEENFSEPNIINNSKNTNYYKLKSKLSDFMTEINLYNKKSKNISKNIFSLTKPAIKSEKYKYNLNFINDYNKDNLMDNKYGNNLYKNNNNINNFLNYNLNNGEEKRNTFNRNHSKPFCYASNIKNNIYFGSSSNILRNTNTKTLNDFDYIKKDKYNFNNKNYEINNNNMIFNDIKNLKYFIRNLSNEDINNLPFSFYKEIQDLYNLMYIKFFKNN